MDIAQGAYRERGLVLHTTKYGEGQMIVHMLTSTHARRSYIVRIGSSRRSGTASRSMFQPLYLLEFQSGTGHGDLHKLNEVRLCPPLQTIPYSTPKSAVALFTAELLYRVVRDEVGDVFDMASQMILELDSASSSIAVANFHLYFMVQLAVRLGYAPSMEFRTGEFFDMKLGEFVRDCPAHTLYMNPTHARLLYDLTVFSIDDLSTIELSRVTRREFLSLMVDYYAYHTEAIRSVRSIDMLAEIF